MTPWLGMEVVNVSWWFRLYIRLYRCQSREDSDSGFISVSTSVSLVRIPIPASYPSLPLSVSWGFQFQLHICLYLCESREDSDSGFISVSTSVSLVRIQASYPSLPLSVSRGFRLHICFYLCHLIHDSSPPPLAFTTRPSCHPTLLNLRKSGALSSIAA